MSFRSRRTWSSRSRSSRPSSGFSLVESNFRVNSPEIPPPMEIHIHRKERSRDREITINDAPMMLLPKARLRENSNLYDNFRRAYSVVADTATQGLHISTIQSVATMEPRILPKSAMKSRRNSFSRSEADSGISSLKRSVTFENLTRSQSSVYRSDEDYENMSDISNDDKSGMDHEDRQSCVLPPLIDFEFPDHLDTFGGDEPILAHSPHTPRPPSRTSISSQTKRRKHGHINDESAETCEICGTLLTEMERMQKKFGKVDKFLKWVMSKWGKLHYSKNNVSYSTDLGADVAVGVTAWLKLRASP